MPASDRAAATLRLAGKPLAASRALPEKTRKGTFTSLTSILFSTRYGAPSSPRIARPPATLREALRAGITRIKTKFTKR
jgi:hypothetical protein